MFFRQFYDQPLAQASYLIGCQATGEAIVVDPLRDPAPYMEAAQAEGLRITHITETHIHADFVSGARELRVATDAQLYLSAEGGTDWQYAFAAEDQATLLRDGDHIMVGNIRLDVMHTPGHTPEHLSFVVTDTPRAAGPMGIITGDFVFVGDVGRPDLLEKAAKIANTMEAGAHTLFASLERFRQLPDHLQLWPGHGAGSACGKALGAVPSSTVGYEKLANWGVATTDEAEFVRMVLDGQPEPPRYFAEMKRINRDGPPVLGARSPLPLLAAAEVASRVRTDVASVWCIDVRPAASFAQRHVPGSLSVPYGRSFSTWVGSIVPYSVDVILLAPHDKVDSAEAERIVTAARSDLLRIGLDRVCGWSHAEQVITAIEQLGGEAGQIAERDVNAAEVRGAELPVVDVRGLSEWSAGHLPHAQHIPLGDLAERLGELPPGAFGVQCQSGARSAIATSLLHRLGRSDAVNLRGGYAAWQRARLAAAP
jgi:hydroxyacylglutathione hydrolase